MPTIPPNKIIDLARECIGTPYGHQGRICGKVMDCAGPLIHVLKGLGFEYSDEKGYPGRPYRGMLEKILSRQPHLKEISLSELSAGDVVLFRISTSPQHIGIYTGKNIIHAYAPSNKVTEQDFAPWKSQLKHVYRFVQ